MNLKETIQEAYNNVFLFNKIATNLDAVTPESVDNQLSFIYEELVETIDAIESFNEVELVDGACDLFVTVAGLMQKLEAAGFDVAGALAKVNANNLSKFPDYDVRGSHLLYQPNNTTINVNEQYSVVVYKDVETGKIKKPTNFVPVDLSGYKIGFLKGGV